MDLDRILERMIEEIECTDGIALEDIPGIDLYMDQLTTFMDDHLRSRSRNPGEDKILTKTMINNYAKNDLLPPPVRKKYSKDHLLLLLFIYYLKSILSISDINTMIQPLKEYFHVSDTEDVTLSKVYKTVQKIALENRGTMEEDLREKARLAKESFPDLEGEEGDTIRAFLFFILTAYDVYMKKLLIEKAVDAVAAAQEKEAYAGRDKKSREKARKHKGKNH